MIVIGITGMLGAGKGTVVEYLETKGFKHYSASDFIVREIKKRGMPVDRDSMNVVGDDLRAIHGSGYVIESLYKEASASHGDAIIESIHTTGEVDALKGLPGFYLLAVDADPKVRYEHIRSRAGVKDNVSFEKFIADEEREIHSTDPGKHNLAGCVELADYKLANDGSVEELHAQVNQVLAEIHKKQATQNKLDGQQA